MCHLEEPRELFDPFRKVLGGVDVPVVQVAEVDEEIQTRIGAFLRPRRLEPFRVRKPEVEVPVVAGA